jgi:hypothetical protein
MLTASDASRARALLPCRAIAVEGEVTPDSDGDAGPALAADAELSPEHWMSLGPGARLVAKDPRTTRETTFRGPGRVRACVDGLEESWLARGTFESSHGAGETPGAEEWVVTPLGAVRFAAAKLSVEALAREVRVSVSDGSAFVWLARDASARGADGGALPGPGEDAAADPGEGWMRVDAGAAALLPRVPRSPLEAARSAVDSCVALGRSAGDLALKLVSGDGGGGATAARQVATRRMARAACATAELRVEWLGADNAGPAAHRGQREYRPLEPASRAEIPRLAASLEEASGFWRSLPLVR